MESLEKELEGLREEIDDLKKVTHFTSWLLHFLARERALHLQQLPCKELTMPALCTFECNMLREAAGTHSLQSTYAKQQALIYTSETGCLQILHLTVCRHYMASSAIPSTWTERL